MSDIKNEGDLLARSRQLIIDAAAQQLRAIHEAKLRIPLSTAGLGAAPPTPVRAPQASNESANMLFDLARLSVQTSEQWLRFADSNFQFIVDSLFGRSPEPDTRGTIALQLHQVGDIATARFTIENPFSSRARVSFTKADLCAVQGSHRLDAPAFHRILADGQPDVGENEFVLEPRRPSSASPSVRTAPPHVGHFEAAVTVPDDARPGRYHAESTVVVDRFVAGRLVLDLTVP